MSNTFKKLMLAAAALVLIGAGCVQIKGGAPNADGGVFRSVDKGSIWQQKSAIATVGTPKSMASLNVTDIAFDPSDPKAVYAATDENGLFFSYDAAESWQNAAALGPIPVSAAAVNPANKCMVFAASGNHIARTLDCARTWQNMYVDTRLDTRITDLAVDFFNAGVVYASTSQGDFLRSSDNGVSWSSVKRFDGEIRQFLMTSKDSRVIFVVTKSKGIWKTADGGASWADLSSKFGSFAGALAEVILVEDTEVPNAFITASHYGLLRTADGGDSWKVIPLLTPPGSTVIYSLAVNPKNSSEIYYGTVNTLYRTTDGGAKWITARLPTSRAATRLVVDPSNQNALYMGTTLFQKKSSGGL